MAVCYRCPRCGETISADELIELEDDERDGARLSAAPPKHLMVRTEIVGLAPVTTVRYRRVNPMVLFLIPFTCAWGGISLF